MIRFVVRRLLWMIPTLFLITFLVFIAIRIGTDPVQSYLRINPRATPAKVLQYKKTNGLTGNIVSQYWNLLVSFGEQRHSGWCAQFATGCGVVRRSVFLSAGMYDEWRFDTASMESVELGERLLGAGGGVLLSSELKVTHLKVWDLKSVSREVWHRSREIELRIQPWLYRVLIGRWDVREVVCHERANVTSYKLCREELIGIGRAHSRQENCSDKCA